jgi:hypothetical protein
LLLCCVGWNESKVSEQKTKEWKWFMMEKLMPSETKYKIILMLMQVSVLWRWATN